MRRIFILLTVATFFLCLGALSYGVKGWLDASQSAETLQARADYLIDQNLGGESLGAEKLALLLRVQDPDFYNHNGIDLKTPGAGITTLTQSLSKRLAFKKFTPGIGKIRQTGYALALDNVLTKEQQIALFLETVEMGRSEGGWITGFHKASETFFKMPVSDLSKEQFIRLVAVLIAPGKYTLGGADTALDERARRIMRLSKNECSLVTLTDVWLDSCK